MVKFSHLLFDKSLHGLGKDWGRNGLTSFGRQFLMTSYITYSLGNRRPKVVFTANGRSKRT